MINKKNIKKQNGFTGMDILISIGIIALFTGIVVTISYNIYLASSSVKRVSQANSYIIDIFEQVDRIDYDKISNDVIDNTLVNYFNQKYYNNETKKLVKAKIADSSETIDTPYKVEIKVEKYNETTGDTNKLDLVKTITVNVSYKVGNKEQVLTMSKVKSRENLISPNIPDIAILKNVLSLDTDNQIVPIKYENGNWVACSTTDASWYNYDNGYWATVLVLNEQNIGQQFTIGDTIETISDFGSMYIWIPRYTYKETDNTDILFVYGTSDKYVESTVDANGNIYRYLEEIPTGYTKAISSINSNNLFNEEEKGRWIVESDTTQTEIPYFYYYLNSSKYTRKNIGNNM